MIEAMRCLVFGEGNPLEPQGSQNAAAAMRSRCGENRRGLEGWQGLETVNPFLLLLCVCRLCRELLAVQAVSLRTRRVELGAKRVCACFPC